MIPIYWRNVNVTVQGSVLKTVHCMNCSIDYVYQLKRRGVGTGASLYGLNNEGALDRAKDAAEANLNTLLDRDFDAVPCPICGWYQEFMIPKVRHTKWQWIVPAEIALGLVGIVLLLFAVAATVTHYGQDLSTDFASMLNAWLLFGFVASIGVSLPILRYCKFRHFDPNVEDQDARIALWKEPCDHGRGV